MNTKKKMFVLFVFLWLMRSRERVSDEESETISYHFEV